jgi:pimeloyl-ACP methyl ester carboxylesterase
MLTNMPDLVRPDGVRLRYEVFEADDPRPDRPPVLLLHGFASSVHINWVRPRIVDAVTSTGRTAIAYDARGHGESDKPHDPGAYGPDTLVDDAVAVLDQVGADRAHVAGYSMGTSTALGLATRDLRVRSLVAGGMGDRVFASRDDGDAVADALEAEDPSTIDEAGLRRYRDFVSLTGGDRMAMAALRRGGMPSIDRTEAAGIFVPVLVLLGDDDTMVGSPFGLAEALTNARLEVVGGTHLNVINNPAFARAIVGFLDGVDEGSIT